MTMAHAVKPPCDALWIDKSGRWGATPGLALAAG